MHEALREDGLGDGAGTSEMAQARGAKLRLHVGGGKTGITKCGEMESPGRRMGAMLMLSFADLGPGKPAFLAASVMDFICSGMTPLVMPWPIMLVPDSKGKIPLDAVQG